MPAGAIILGCLGPVLSQAEAAFFRDADPFGFILFARNVQDPAQLRKLTSDLRDAVGRDAPVLVDQEGGRVQRLRAPHWREFLPPLDQVQRTAGARLERAMWLRYRLIADELQQVGIDVDCAPCADLACPLTHPFLRNRCLGEDPPTVIAAARAAAAGLLAGGVLPVIKHMPGHGRARVDSHLECPCVTAGLDELDNSDFAVFRGLADLPMGMTGHIVFDAIDPERPATASPPVIAAIRDRIGFGGLLLSDDLSMQALSGDIAARTAASLDAGCDIALHCNGRMDEMRAVAAAARLLSVAGVARADHALALRRVGDDIDPAACVAELADLVGTPVDV